ncbi:MAG: HAMP domain-containing protein [Chloroflexi bacterium]|nr:HAMP domain-containing protein [Chloroflexota bacterium]
MAPGRGVGPLRSLTWRIALPYIALILVSIAVVSIYLASRAGLSLDGMPPTIAIVAGVTSGLAVALAVLIARRTTRSLRRVTTVARRLASGDLGQRVQVDSSDEAGELGRAFNEMAGSLKKMLADLGSERDRLAAILSAMSEGVVMTDRDGAVVLANPSAEKLLGASPLFRKRLVEVVRDHELHRLLNDCARAGRQTRGEIEVAVSQRSLEVTATPMSGQDVPGMLIVFHDVTGLRKMEKTRREFVANVSHELRTPLSSIKAAVETLQDGALDDPQAALTFLSRLGADVDRMAALVSDLLELSRLESGQVSPELARVELGPLVNEVLERLLPVVDGKELRVTVDLPVGLSPVLADREMMRQVVSNLLGNAVKFTPAGGSIAVTAAAAGPRVAVTVADTGIGIAPEHMARIFERFFKVDRSRSGVGSGLGLSIARHIVQLHGGEILVSSEEGRGSSFTFTVPCDSAR